MALLKAKDAAKLTAKERKEKIEELKTEMIKARVGNKKTTKINLKEVKKAIARLLTIERLEEIKTKTGGNK
ncbi:50S ribosomal protein L29 [Candidatus Pacearchaeota archaeon]|nr:50S ribosomal protein L29 [Candidatus Pacearchaeota archaeon]